MQNTKVLILLMLLVGQSHAQSSTDSKTPQEYFEEGRRRSTQGDFDGAITNYQKAYDLTAAPGLLFNMAQANRKGHHWQEALTLYERFLKEAGESRLAPEAAAYASAIRERLSAEELRTAVNLAEQRATKAEELAKKLEDERKQAEEAQKNEFAKRQDKPIHKRLWFRVLMPIAAGALVGIITGIGVSQRPADSGDLETRSLRF